MGTQTALTLEQYFALPESDSIRELDEGELIEMPGPKYLHGLIIGRVMAELSSAVKPGKLGEVPAGFACILGPDIVRIPDAAVVLAGSSAAPNADGVFEGAPDITVEVVSPTDSADDIRRKVRQYLGAGGREVWVVYTDPREIDVFTASGVRTVTGALETPLIPGFRLELNELFR